MSTSVVSTCLILTTVESVSKNVTERNQQAGVRREKACLGSAAAIISCSRNKCGNAGALTDGVKRRTLKVGVGCAPASGVRRYTPGKF